MIFRRYTIEHMREAAIKNKGRCLSKEYINGRSPLKWQCKKGHTWDNTPETILRGAWCVQCLKTDYLEEAGEIAESRGGKCLSKDYINNRTKLQWKCDRGHSWKAAAGNVKNGSWCPVCAKGSVEEMQELASKNEGKCLSKKYVHSQVKLKWECKKGHQWLATPSVIRTGHWCYICAVKRNGEKMRDTIENMHRMAAERGGKCLSKKYVDGIKKLKWECELGHRWSTSPNLIKKGTWCPVCGMEKSKKNLDLAPSRLGKSNYK